MRADVVRRGPHACVSGALTGLGVYFALSGGASAATIYVDANRGNDSNSGRGADPVRTITRGAALARRGDQVRVRAGRYRETVALSNSSSGVVFRAAPGSRPVVDGEGRRTFGFNAIGTSRIRIQGFEVRGQKVAGVQVREGTRNVVRQMYIHNVGAPEVSANQGIQIVRGVNNRVVGNVVHSIGPGFESRGIWLLQTKRATVTRNVVYLVRKDGIRDWQSLGNRITSNRFFLNHNGISFSQTTGAYAANNYSGYNEVGFVAKHVSNPRGLRYWSLSRGRMSRFRNNTVEDNNEAGIWIGNSEEPLDYLSVASNLFRGGGFAFVRDVPSLRGPKVKLDGNVYVRDGSRPASIYKEGWRTEPAPLNDWAAYQEQVGWDANGLITTAQSQRSTRSGGDRVGAYEGRAGARRVPRAPVVWNRIAMTPIDSSSKGSSSTVRNLDKVADNNSGTYWITDTAENEFVTLDLQGDQTFNTLTATVFGHFDERNVHGYRFEVSDDRETWRTIAEGENPDMAGSSYKYELKEPVTARYLRYTMVDTSCTSYEPREGCGPYFVLTDIAAGLLLTPRLQRAWTEPPRPPY